MYIGNFGRENVETFCIISQRIFTETLRDLHQTFGDLSFFLPASDSARAQGVAIGLASCEVQRFSGRYPAGLWHLA